MSTTTDMAARSSADAGILTAFAASLKRCWQAYSELRLRRIAVAHLRSLSDYQLRDIGLDRAEIRSAVAGDRAFPRWF